MQILGSRRSRHYEAGISYFDHGQYDLAIRELKCVVEGNGASRGEAKLGRFYLGQAYALLAESHLQKHQWTQAEENLLRALEINPHYPDLRFSLAQVYYFTRDMDRASRELSNALRLNPDYAKAIFLSGLIRYRQGKHALGLGEMERAADLDADFMNDHLDQAKAQHAAGDHEQAGELFEKAGQMYSDYVGDLIRAAKDRLKEGALHEAEVCLGQALASNPDYPDLRNMMGQVKLLKGEYLPAVHEFKAALLVNPAFVAAHINLGRACRGLGTEDAAQEAFRRALALEPDNEEARKLLSAD